MIIPFSFIKSVLQGIFSINIQGTSSGPTNDALNTTNIPDVTNGSVNNATGLMTATADNCVSSSKEYAQTGGDPDFATITSLYEISPYKLDIDPSTTSTSIVLTSAQSGLLVNDDELIVDDGGAMKIVAAGSVAETTEPGAAQTSTTAGTPALVSASNDIVFIANNAGTNTNSPLMGWINNGSGLTAVNFPSGQGVASYSVIIGDIIIVAANSSASANVIGWRSTDRGITWSDITVSPGLNTGLNRIYNSGNTVIITDISTAKIFRSTNTGASWTAITPPSTLTRIDANGTTWVAIGSTPNAWRSTDDGVTWNSIASVTAYTSLSNIANNGSLWFISGGNGASSAYGFLSIDDGATFSSQTNAAAGIGGGIGVDVSISGTTIIVARNDTTWVRSTDSGTTWSALTSMNANWSVWSNGTHWVSTSSGQATYKESTDNGATFSIVTPSPAYQAGNYNPAAFTPNGNLYISDRSNVVISGSNRRVLIGGTYDIYQYTCTSLTSVFGTVPLSNAPTWAALGGQSYSSSVTSVAGTTSYVTDTIASITRLSDLLTIGLDNRAAPGRYVRLRVTCNNADVVSRYSADLFY